MSIYAEISFAFITGDFAVVPDRVGWKISAYAGLLPALVGDEAALNTPEDKRAEAAIEAIARLGRELHDACGLPLTLEAAGVPKESLAQVAAVAVNDGALIVNPRAADEQQVISILNAAF